VDDPINWNSIDQARFNRAVEMLLVRVFTDPAKTRRARALSGRGGDAPRAFDQVASAADNEFTLPATNTHESTGLHTERDSVIVTEPLSLRLTKNAQSCIAYKINDTTPTRNRTPMTPTTARRAGGRSGLPAPLRAINTRVRPPRATRAPAATNPI